MAAYDPRFSTVFTSGGGFSNYFPRPAYQDASVPAYLAKYVGSTYAGLYNTSGRGIPDLAAQGQNYSTVWNGTVRPTDGTSASTPAVAAIIALVNDALISAGRRPLGFINVRPFFLARLWIACVLKYTNSHGSTVAALKHSTTS